MSVIYARIGTSIFYEVDQALAVTPPGQVIMPGYPPANSSAGNPYFEWRANAQGQWYEFKLPAPAVPVMWYDGRLQTQNPDNSFTPMPANSIPARRRIPLSVTLGTNGVATLDLSSYNFTAAPTLFQVVTKNAAGQTMYPKFADVKAGSATISGERTRATLVLSQGPFEPCVAGDVVSLIIQEN